MKTLAPLLYDLYNAKQCSSLTEKQSKFLQKQRELSSEDYKAQVIAWQFLRNLHAKII